MKEINVKKEQPKKTPPKSVQKKNPPKKWVEKSGDDEQISENSVIKRYGIII